ncbi:MAG: hypothetical protein ABIN89_01035 [Chitinophagaceae bacterium]
MQCKFSPAAAIILFLSLMALFSCKQNQNGGNVNDTFKFDSATAAKSVIPIAEAVTLQQSFISTYGEVKKLIRDTSYLAKNFNIPNGEAFSKDAILLLLSQKEAVGIRVYYGKDSKGVVRLVLLPVRKDGSVIYNKLITGGKPAPDSASRALSSAFEAVETGQTCPPCLIDVQLDQ